MSTPTPVPVLKIGSSGDAVVAWQAFLVGRGAVLKIDGDFGPATATATKAYQQLWQIPATGQVDSKLLDAAAKHGYGSAPAVGTWAPKAVKIYKAVPSSMLPAAEEAVPLLLKSCESERVVDNCHIAYIMGTVEHESRFQPIREGLARRGTRLWNIQDRYWPSHTHNNIDYYGRSYVQLTWEFNYVLFGGLLRIDLAGNPDLALKPEYAAPICVIGMHRGLFTGKKLAKYGKGSDFDFVEARRTVNGTDKAQHIAGLAMRYYQALTKAA